jgi:hypothetical protein
MIALARPHPVAGPRRDENRAPATGLTDVPTTRLAGVRSVGAAARCCAGAVAATCLLAACTATPVYPPTAPSTGRRPPPREATFSGSELLKSDIDAVAEVHLRESVASARLLMEKLYRRNPRELRKSGAATPEAAVARAFDPGHKWRFPELSGTRGIDALQIAFRPDYTGDRVFAFGVGLGSMITQAYDDKTQFYLTDSLDAQRLYNAARNVEIAAWKLANTRGPNGALLLLSNDMSSTAPNLSFEREIGKLVAYQDTLALVMAQRTNRTLRRFTQGLATAVFLPL